MQEHYGLLLCRTFGRRQVFDIHLIPEYMVPVAVVRILSTDIEVLADVWYLVSGLAVALDQEEESEEQG